MGLWSSFKNAVKKVWRKVKAVVRTVVRVVVEIIGRVIGIFDLLLGFLLWPSKNLRLHVMILWSEAPPSGGDPLPPIENAINDTIDRTKRLYKDKFNVNIKPYTKSFIQKYDGAVPSEALDFSCGIGSEYGVAGEFFAKNLAGWNAIPISLTYPVTVFVVRDMPGGDLGCSMSVIGDYIVIDREGLVDNVALAHELGHTCGLWHSKTSNNLMFESSPAGENVKWFQKNLLRSSRHVNYW
jgi:hypothetical protein